MEEGAEANPRSSNIARISTGSSSGNEDRDNCAKVAPEESHQHAKQGDTDMENSRRNAAAADAAAHPPNPPHSSTTRQSMGSKNMAKDNAVEFVHLFMGSLLKSNNAGGDGTLVAKTNPVETRKRIERKRQINRESAKRKRVRAKQELEMLAKQCEELQASNQEIKSDNGRLLETIRVETEKRNVLSQLQMQLTGRGTTAAGATSSQPPALQQLPRMTTQAPSSQRQPSSQLQGNLANQVQQLMGQYQQIASVVNSLSAQQQQQQPPPPPPQQNQQAVQDMLRSLRSLLLGTGNQQAPVASNPSQQLPFAVPPAPLRQIINPSTNNASPPNNQVEELQKLLLVLALAAYFTNMQQQQQQQNT